MQLVDKAEDICHHTEVVTAEEMSEIHGGMYEVTEVMGNHFSLNRFNVFRWNAFPMEYRTCSVLR